MADNAVHVEFPTTMGRECISPGGHIVIVSGCRGNLVDRAIRSIKQLVDFIHFNIRYINTITIDLRLLPGLNTNCKYPRKSRSI